MNTRIITLGLLFGLLSVGLTTPTLAQPEQQPQPPDRFANRDLPESVKQLKLSTPRTVSAAGLDKMDARLFGAEGRQTVIIRLKTPSVAETDLASPAANRAQQQRVRSEQQAFLGRAQSIDSTFETLAQVQVVLNAVAAEVDAAQIPALASDPAIERVAAAINYRLVLSETVPYIGATAVHELGVDGAGVRVAVLDTGIDYTHASLGGSGNPADYAANDPTVIEVSSFPTDKVAGGFDFVGGQWTGEEDSPPLLPDPDPLDVDGHGTHVSDIIGGSKGVAPGVDLYGLKVCSDITPFCSGVALIQAMEFAVDPDGDGDPSDHMDIVNMSLGSDYGQTFDDDLSTAVDNATKVGILTVAASGNGGDEPYITSSPAAASTAISVAQTHVPSAFLPFMTVLQPEDQAGEYVSIHQPWSAPLSEVIEGPVQYGDGAGGNLNGCAPFAPESLSGIVAVDRGVCFFSDKIRNIENGGGALGIIMLVAPGAPFPGGFGGGPPIGIPGFMISQADGNILRTGEAVVRFDPENGMPLVGTVVSSSSRGPEFQDNRLKPDIGAPGASVSAEVGTGTGETAFGGTSGATPMISGSAALLIQGRSDDFRDDFEARGPSENVVEPFDGDGRSPLEVKALLMNGVETNILNDAGGPLAALPRIGAGEVRVDRSFAAPAALWAEDGNVVSLSFGFVDVADQVVELTESLRLRNYSNREITYQISSSFRFGDDEANGAVSLEAPESVTVGPKQDTSFEVTLIIDGAQLRNNLMNSGSLGANPGPLTTNEYDGYLLLDDGDRTLRLPWHVLPRKAARLQPDQPMLNFGGGTMAVVNLTNSGMGTAQNDGYSLIATSTSLPRGDLGGQSPTPDLRAIGVNTFPVPAGFCSGAPSYVMAFAVNTWQRQTHAVGPGIYWFDLDVDRNGTLDFSVFNYDLAFLGSVADGRNVTWVIDWAALSASAFFFTEHAMNTANTVLYICGEQIGSVPFFQNMNATAFAFDIFFGGPGDVVEGLTFAPLGERFVFALTDIPPMSINSMVVFDLAKFGLPVNPSEIGLLVFTNGDRGATSRGGATEDTEALILRANLRGG